jgi:hypothetical protein
MTTELNKKHCWKCDQDLPVTEFHKAKNRRDGLQPTCKSCQRKLSADWAARNRDKANAQYRRWYASMRHPHHPPKVAQAVIRINKLARYAVDENVKETLKGVLDLLAAPTGNT